MHQKRLLSSPNKNMRFCAKRITLRKPTYSYDVYYDDDDDDDDNNNNNNNNILSKHGKQALQ
jgi:hypothetical protein